MTIQFLGRLRWWVVLAALALPACVGDYFPTVRLENPCPFPIVFSEWWAPLGEVPDESAMPYQSTTVEARDSLSESLVEDRTYVYRVDDIGFRMVFDLPNDRSRATVRPDELLCSNVVSE